jgi:hypothetical protein
VTTTAEIESSLLSALSTIRQNWAALLLPSGSGGMGGTASSDVVTGLDRRVSLRHEVTLSLNGWARLIVEDRNLTHLWQPCEHGVKVTLARPLVGPTRPRCASRIEWAKDENGVPQVGHHVIDGTDALGLCVLIERHARWFAGHEAAMDAAEELTTWAREVKATAAPARREWVYLGDCPFVVEDWFCRGQVRGYADPDRLPSCSDCGQEAVAEWWEEVFGLDELIGLGALVNVVRETTGRTVSRFTLSRWVRSGRIPVSGTDAQGRETFSRRSVAAALTRELAG